MQPMAIVASPFCVSIISFLSVESFNKHFDSVVKKAFKLQEVLPVNSIELFKQIRHDYEAEKWLLSEFESVKLKSLVVQNTWSDECSACNTYTHGALPG